MIEERIYTTIECPKCKGKGNIKIDKSIMSCVFCNGSGKVSGWKIKDEERT